VIPPSLSTALDDRETLAGAAWVLPLAGDVSMTTGLEPMQPPRNLNHRCAR
jgi:hypothetical protein